MSQINMGLFWQLGDREFSISTSSSSGAYDWLRAPAKVNSLHLLLIHIKF